MFESYKITNVLTFKIVRYTVLFVHCMPCKALLNLVVTRCELIGVIFKRSKTRDITLNVLKTITIKVPINYTL